MNPEASLQEYGLTKNEAKVYVALLDIGSTTTSKLIKRVGINTSKVYESLERLLKKGMVSYSIIKNIKHWQAENPKAIQQYIDEEIKTLEEKKLNSENLIAQLMARQATSKDTTEYKVFEGIRGIKAAREHVFDVLKKGDVFYLILSSYPNDEKLSGYWEEFQAKRAEKGICCKYILNETLRQIGGQRMTLPFTEARYVSPGTLSPTWVEIYGDSVSIGVLGQMPSIFVIKNRSVAEGFINYFNFLWKIGKK